MKKTILTLTLLLVSAMSAFAAKTTIYIAPFTGGDNVTFDEYDLVRSKVIEAFSNIGRFTIIDAETGADDANVKFRVNGHVNAVTYTQTNHKNSDGKTYTTFDASVTMTLSAVNLATGETISSMNFDSNRPIWDVTFIGDEIAYTQPIALRNAANYMAKKKFPKWIEETFPASGSILELDEVKGDEVKTAFISLGSQDGLKKGQKFTVKLKTTVANRTRFKEIGEAQCEAVEGEDISLVKIKKGGKEIFKAYSETPGNLIIQTKK